MKVLKSAQNSKKIVRQDVQMITNQSGGETKAPWSHSLSERPACLSWKSLPRWFCYGLHSLSFNKRVSNLFMSHCSILHTFYDVFFICFTISPRCALFGFSVAQISFVTVEQGQPATLQCFVQKGFVRRQLQWYKQSAGDTLKMITSIRVHVSTTFGPGFPPSRFQLTDNTNEISLTIFQTTHEDEGMYHCALMDWMDAFWSTTYLSIKGKNLICNTLQLKWIMCLDKLLKSWRTFSFKTWLHFNFVIQLLQTYVIKYRRFSGWFQEYLITLHLICTELHYFKHICLFYAAGSNEGIFNNVIVDEPTVSSAVHEGNSATLQCSVLSTSRDKPCPALYSFHWFRAGENKSVPNVLYVSGEQHQECDSQSCIYHFSKNISSHDMGTYYCALAACGEILFGNGTRLGATRGLCKFVLVWSPPPSLFSIFNP